METISVAEAFERIENDSSVVLLYVLKSSKINSTLENVCELIDEHNKVVNIVKVEIDPENLTKKDARKIGLIRLPQLRFYSKGSVLLGTMTGQTAPSEVYEKILSIYT